MDSIELAHAARDAATAYVREHPWLPNDDVINTKAVSEEASSLSSARSRASAEAKQIAQLAAALDERRMQQEKHFWSGNSANGYRNVPVFLSGGFFPIMEPSPVSIKVKATLPSIRPFPERLADSTLHEPPKLEITGTEASLIGSSVDGKQTMSMTRGIAPNVDSVRGASFQLPFLPGGFVRQSGHSGDVDGESGNLGASATSKSRKSAFDLRGTAGTILGAATGEGSASADSHCQGPQCKSCRAHFDAFQETGVAISADSWWKNDGRRRKPDDDDVKAEILAASEKLTAASQSSARVLSEANEATAKPPVLTSADAEASRGVSPANAEISSSAAADYENVLTEDDVVVAKHQRREYMMGERAWVQARRAEHRDHQDRVLHTQEDTMKLLQPFTGVAPAAPAPTVSTYARKANDQRARSQAVDALLLGEDSSTPGAATAFDGIDWVQYIRSHAADRRRATGRDPSDSLTTVVQHVFAIEENVENTDENTLAIAQEFTAAIPNPVLVYPFELDNFQKRALMHLERNENVFVAAHTSAGKTVVAEYAIALSHKHMTRTIYTSPIKALSNQKFRDFSQLFDCGIITGDVSINPQASCLVCTTEILRSMLYRGADVLRDVEWVVFDECHYINDAERGVVWEEVIIMLPEHVSLIFLSATVPNAVETAEWVGRTKRKNVFVLSTTRRPVPLQHYLYLGTGMAPDSPVAASGRDLQPYEKSMFLIASSDNKKFYTDNYRKILRMLKERQKAQEQKKQMSRTKRQQRQGRISEAESTTSVSLPRHSAGSEPKIASAKNTRTTTFSLASDLKAADIIGSGAVSPTYTQENMSEWYALLQNLKKCDMLPAVVFVFSKRKIEELATNLGGLDLTSKQEKYEVSRVIREIITGRLAPRDQALPQVRSVCSMVMRGIGVHHGGLLPLVKEMTEILFSEGLVKVLFATETFAMGVNFPAKTVVFASVRKHDGTQFRDLTPAEYTQMSGRAGRRGKDKVGLVIIRHWEASSFSSQTELPELATFTKMIMGKSDPLESKFRLTYGMILNLLRISEYAAEYEQSDDVDENAGPKPLSVTNILRKSFAEHNSQRFIEDTGRKLLNAAEHRLQDVIDIECLLDEPGCPPQGRELIDSFSAKFALTLRLEHDAWDQLFGASTGTPYSKAVIPTCLVPGRVLVLDASSALGALAEGEAELIPNVSVRSNRFVLGVCVNKPSPTASECSCCFLVPSEPALDLRPVGIMLAGSTPDASDVTASARNRLVFAKNVSLKSIQRVCDMQLKLDAQITGVGGWMKLQDRSERNNLRMSLQSQLAELGFDLASQSIARLTQSTTDQEATLVWPPASLDILQALNLRDYDLNEQFAQAKIAEHEMTEEVCFSCPLLLKHVISAETSRQLREAKAGLEYVLSDESLLLFPEYQARLAVLEALGYIDTSTNSSGDLDSVKVRLKGQVARELNSLSSELCATEIIFAGDLLTSLSAAEVAAFLSTMIFEERVHTGGMDELDCVAKMRTLKMPTRAIENAKDTCIELAEGLAALQMRCGVPITTDEFVESTFNFGAVELVFEWARGMSFADIMALSAGSIAEGSVVRCITRLNEVFRQVANAAELMGNEELVELMEAASEAVRRDIVFAGSLYV